MATHEALGFLTPSEIARKFAALEERIKALEERVSELEQKFEDHYHHVEQRASNYHLTGGPEQP